MGTHPIFESDFDCLTDCFNVQLTARFFDHGRITDRDGDGRDDAAARQAPVRQVQI